MPPPLLPVFSGRVATKLNACALGQDPHYVVTRFLCIKDRSTEHATLHHASIPAAKLTMPPPTSSRVTPAHGAGSSAQRGADADQEDGGKAEGGGGSRKEASVEERGKVRQMCLMFPNMDPQRVALVLTSVGFDDNEAVLMLSSMSVQAASGRYIFPLASSRWSPDLVLNVYGTCARSLAAQGPCAAARAFPSRPFAGAQRGVPTSDARPLTQACCREGATSRRKQPRDLVDGNGQPSKLRCKAKAAQPSGRPCPAEYLLTVIFHHALASLDSAAAISLVRLLRHCP